MSFDCDCNPPRVGDRAAYTFHDGTTVVGRVVAVTLSVIVVKWPDLSSTCVRPAGFVASGTTDYEWEIVR